MREIVLGRKSPIRSVSDPSQRDAGSTPNRPSRRTEWASRLCFLLFATLIQNANAASAPTPSWNAPPAMQTQGAFWRLHWYERGLTNGNPGYQRRLRINSPEASLHPTFGKRTEARENGLAVIRAEEDLFNITAAELYLETWGGHPGTANKRFTINGRTTYSLPKVGTEEGHCTYFYPAIKLARTDLVNGWNVFQFALDQGTTFWGHALIDEACLRVALTNSHPDLRALGLHELSASVQAHPRPPPQEGFILEAQIPNQFLTEIASVDFQAWYSGYDENHDLRGTDWHGFTKNRLPVAHVGSASEAPFRVTWDTSMLPAQKNVAIRAIVHFRRADSLVYLTPAATALTVRDHPGATIALYAPTDLPTEFWSRANRLQTCHFVIDVAPSRIERAELYAVTWTGGAGQVKDYFKLNGWHFPVAEGSRHEVQFSRLPVEPALLREGTNTVEVLSDTEHHGIEILYPGPALMIRYRN